VPRKKRHKHKKGHKRKPARYIYARTQNLFTQTPGLLAKHVRENVSYIEQGTIQLPTENIETLYRGLSDTIPNITQPISGELGEADNCLDLHNLLPSIMIKDIRTRIAQTKTNTAAGPDGLTKNHIKGRRTQELRLIYTFIKACGRQPTA
jgi:hypothetical protein